MNMNITSHARLRRFLSIIVIGVIIMNAFALLTGCSVFEADTAYLGHHYVECLIKRTYNSQNVRIRFGVYVR